MKKEDWKDSLWLLGGCYLMMGVVLLLVHKDEATPEWIWWACFAASPLLVVALIVAQAAIFGAGIAAVAATLFANDKFPNIFKSIKMAVVWFYMVPHRVIDARAEKAKDPFFGTPPAIYQRMHEVTAAIQFLGTILLIGMFLNFIGVPVPEE